MRSISSFAGCRATPSPSRSRCARVAAGLHRSEAGPGRGAGPWIVGGLGACRRQRAAAAAERAHLLLHLLELGGERPDLRLDAVEAAGIGGADRGRRAGLCRPPAAGAGAVAPRASNSSVPTTTCMSTSCSSSCSMRWRKAPSLAGRRHVPAGWRRPSAPACGPPAGGLAAAAAEPRQASGHGRRQQDGGAERARSAVRDRGHEGVLDRSLLQRCQPAPAATRPGSALPLGSLQHDIGAPARRALNRGGAATAGTRDRRLALAQACRWREAVSTDGPTTVTARRFCAAHAASAHSAIRRSRP